MPQRWPRWVVRTYFGTEQKSVQDFSLGSVQSVARHLIPPGGCYEIRNGLLSQEGTIFLRGGSANWATSDGPDAGGVRGVWAGQLGGGNRVLAWTNAHTFAFNAGVSTTPVTLSTTNPGHPARVSVVGGWAFIDGGWAYAGSLKTASYSTGTIAVTQGSDTVTGSGTTFTGNVDAGMILTVGPDMYYVTSVDSNTQLKVSRPVQHPDGTGLAYSLAPVVQITGTIDPKGGFGFSNVLVQANTYAAVGQKLLLGIGNRVWESASPSDQGVAQPDTIPEGNYVELPGGSNVTGIIGLRGNALIFGTQGLFQLTNVALDIEDASGNPQQSLQQISGDLKLWGKEGLATWENRVIAPCLDDVYLIDGVSAPQPISKSLTSTYRAYVLAGYKPGMATVHANHYILPILDSSDVKKDVLVCRLDRSVRTPFGVFFPWSFMDGAGANFTSLAVLNVPGSPPVLLAGARDTTSRVLHLNFWFTEGHSQTALDQDNSVPVLDFTLGDIQTGPEFKIDNLVKFLRLHYDLTWLSSGPTDTPPVLQAFIATPGTTVWNQLGGDAPYRPTSSAPVPYTWQVNQMTRLARLRFKTSGRTASVEIDGVELEILPRRH